MYRGVIQMDKKVAGIPHNLTWCISGIALCCLLINANIKGIGLGIFGSLAILAFAQFIPKQDLKKIWKATTKTEKIFVLAVCGLACVKFVFMWQFSSLIGRVAEAIHLPRTVFLVVIGLLAAVISYPFVLSVLLGLRKSTAQGMCVPADHHSVSARELLFLLLTAVLTITICSKSSVLYPFNDWVDSNCFFTVGKAAVHGKVIYRDIYEQKGPLLYFLHSFAYLLSNTTFFGVYLLEIAAAFFFLYYSYKIVSLYSAGESLWLMPVLSALVYSSASFCHGDSAEEFCLPLLTYALWVGLRALKEQKQPKLHQYFLIGVTSGCVLWIKYTMLGFYVGWFLVPAALMIAGRQWKRLAQSVGLIGAGVATATAPFLVYFGVNHAIADWFKVYFYDNIFSYSKMEQSSVQQSVFHNIIYGTMSTFEYNLIPMGLVLIGLIWFYLNGNKKTNWYLFACLSGTLILVYAGGQRHIYYALIFSAFSSLGMIAIQNSVVEMLPDSRKRNLSRGKRLANLGAVVGLLLICVVRSSNVYLIPHEKEDLPQYRFRDIIRTVENPTLLNYGFLDGGFYTVCDVVPTCKYFCGLNSRAEEIAQGQKQCLEEGTTDFIVTRDATIDEELYECVATATFPFEGKDRTYYLYSLKSLNFS